MTSEALSDLETMTFPVSHICSNTSSFSWVKLVPLYHWTSLEISFMRVIRGVRMRSCWGKSSPQMWGPSLNHRIADHCSSLQAHFPQWRINSMMAVTPATPLTELITSFKLKLSMWMHSQVPVAVGTPSFYFWTLACECSVPSTLWDPVDCSPPGFPVHGTL